MVEVGGYEMAWVGVPEYDENKSVRPVARSGYENGYLDNVRISWDEANPLGHGPTGTAIDLPGDPESYVHRIGRTGRAGEDGVAVSFCDHGERAALHAIQRLTRQTLSVEAQPAGMPCAAAAPVVKAPARGARQRPVPGHRRGSGVPRSSWR